MRHTLLFLAAIACGCGGSIDLSTSDAATPDGPTPQASNPPNSRPTATNGGQGEAMSSGGGRGAVATEAGVSSGRGAATASVGGSSQDASSTACDLPPTVLQALLNRWNGAAKVAGTVIDFRWSACDSFPHPTYKGGTAEAYGQFAAVLLQFFQQGDDFTFLAQNSLFDVALLDVFPSGMVGLNTTFKQLASDFSSPNGFGNQSAATRKALAGFLAQIP